MYRDCIHIMCLRREDRGGWGEGGNLGQHRKLCVGPCVGLEDTGG